MGALNVEKKEEFEGAFIWINSELANLEDYYYYWDYDPQWVPYSCDFELDVVKILSEYQQFINLWGFTVAQWLQSSYFTFLTEYLTQVA